jgi:homocysteine S-methyltransferase
MPDSRQLFPSNVLILSQGPWDDTIFEVVRKTRERCKWKEILVGGCCQTTPSDIAKLRKRIDQS